MKKLVGVSKIIQHLLLNLSCCYSSFFALVKRKSIYIIFLVFNIVSAGRDITIAFKLLKYRRKDIVILDYSTECGFVAFEK